MHIASGIILFSHATNDCNIFRRKIQSAVNKGRLAMHEVKDDKASFSVHMIDLDKAKVLIRPEQAAEQKGKILSLVRQGRKISMTRFQAREVTMEKTPDGKESLKITVKASRPGGQESCSQKTSRPATQARPVRQKVGPEL